jgi:hypothetical protein
MECTGYWETCNCEDCKYVAYLYEMVEWLECNEDEYLDEIEEIKKKILDMGYSI